MQVLEGGCGVGYALKQLKTGMADNEGLGDAIVTTGVTLTEETAVIAQDRNEVDVVYVGPIDACELPDNTFDFIYDALGAAFYDYRAALPVYGRVLKPGGLAWVMLSGLGIVDVSDSIDIARKIGLRVVESNYEGRGEFRGVLDVLFEARDVEALKRLFSTSS